MAGRSRPPPPAGLDTGGIARRYRELLQPLSLLPPPGGSPGPAPLPAQPPGLPAQPPLLPGSGLPPGLPALLRELVLGAAREQEPLPWAPEPGLSPEQQEELRRRLRCHRALVCEELPGLYLQLLEAGSPGPLRLSRPAALTRLRAQLRQHCGDLLHPGRVRAALLRDMRGEERAEGTAEPAGTPSTVKTTIPGEKHTQKPGKTLRTSTATTKDPEEKPTQSQRETLHTSTAKNTISGDKPTQNQRETLHTSSAKTTDPEEKTVPSPTKPQHPVQKARHSTGADPWSGPANHHQESQQPESMNLPSPGTPEAGSAPEAFTDLAAALTLQRFIKLSRPQTHRPRQQRAEDIRQISTIQPLDLNRLHQLLPCPQEGLHTFRNMPCQAVRTPCPGLPPEEAPSANQDKVPLVGGLKRFLSMPNLRTGDLLADELGIHMKSYLSQTSMVPHTGGTASDGPAEESAAGDLRRLMQASPPDQSDDAELPPLIRALNHRKANAAKFRNMEQRLQSFTKNEEVQLCEDVLISQEPAYPQTDTVDLRVSNKSTLKTADVQVSNRVFMDVSELQKYPPIYNDLLGEIEPATVSRLDRNLFIGEEIREVYTELMQSIPTEHLQFDQDPNIEPYAANVDLSKCLTSATLTRRSAERVINTELANQTHNEQLNRNTTMIADEHMISPNQDNARSPTHSSWLKFWNETLNFDDYLKFVASQDSDYLGVVFHLYNSDDSEDEEEATRNAAVKYQEEQQREKDKMAKQLLAMKQEYIPGMWNSNTILLGGLGANSASALEDLQNKMEEEGITDLQMKMTAEDAAMQCRLEAIWDSLYVPDSERLDMAIKYSSNEYQPLMPAAINAWEKAAEVIQQRELLLAKLELFERTASDPNRLFKRGYEGTLLARTKESKERKALHFQISKTETELFKLLRKIKKTFNDTVTFKGRPYLEKMQWDKIEMLYWLQQQRRKISMYMDTRNETTCVKLPPVNSPL